MIAFFAGPDVVVVAVLALVVVTLLGIVQRIRVQTQLLITIEREVRRVARRGGLSPQRLDHLEDEALGVLDDLAPWRDRIDEARVVRLEPAPPPPPV